MPRIYGFRIWALLGTVCCLTACSGDDGAPARDTATDAGSNGSASSTGGPNGEYVCIPGEVRCSGQTILETCAPTGKEWLSDPCPANAYCQSCDQINETCAADHCVSPCDLSPEFPSSAGCSFIANRQLHPREEWDDGIIIGNPSTEMIASVSVFRVPEGLRKEELVEGFPIALGPGEAFSFEVDSSFVQGTESMFRTGGMFRVASDVPVVGYQHSPFENNRFNDSLLLLPDTVLGTDYVVASYPPVPTTTDGRPSYFEIIAIEDLTTVTWTPPYPTHGNGLPIKPVPAGESGTVKMNRFDTMRVAASNADPEVPLIARDLSGTVIHADKPIWVVGATRCSAAPVPPLLRFATCNNIEELLFPLSHWGRKYVAAAPPPRAEEWVHWRIYAGNPNVTVSSEPAVDGLPHTFSDRGEYVDISVPHLTHLFLEGDGPFMPVLHLQAHVGTIYTDESQADYEFLPGTDGAGVGGDTSMSQGVPVEQYLSRYVFMTGVGYGRDWVVVIRRLGGADILVDGALVQDYAPVADFEVAHVAIMNLQDDDTDTHVAESAEPFGLVQVGYSVTTPLGEEGADGCVDPDAAGYCRSSYAHPGGMKSEVLYIP